MRSVLYKACPDRCNAWVCIMYVYIACLTKPSVTCALIYVRFYVCMFILYCKYFVNQLIKSVVQHLTERCIVMHVCFCISMCLNCIVNHLLIDEEYSVVQSLHSQMHCTYVYFLYVGMPTLYCKYLVNWQAYFALEIFHWPRRCIHVLVYMWLYVWVYIYTVFEIFCVSTRYNILYKDCAEDGFYVCVCMHVFIAL
jgi:hypothetical protein